MNIRFLEIAKKELDAAVEYYRQQQKNLDQLFLQEVMKTLNRIQKFPSAWHVLTKGNRRCRVHRFPYYLIYAAGYTEILILAVAHFHRKPGYWVT